MIINEMSFALLEVLLLNKRVEYSEKSLRSVLDDQQSPSCHTSPLDPNVVAFQTGSDQTECAEIQSWRVPTLALV